MGVYTSKMATSTIIEIKLAIENINEKLKTNMTIGQKHDWQYLLQKKKESLTEAELSLREPGFYIGTSTKAATLDDVKMCLMPPFPMRLSRVVHVSATGVWNTFTLNITDKNYNRYVHDSSFGNIVSVTLAITVNEMIEVLESL